MKKEWLALLLLGIILCGSIWNLRHLDRMTEELLAMTEGAYLRADPAAAEEAEGYWKRAGTYTSIFLRHAEADAVTDAFCAFRGAIAGGDAGELLGAYLILRAHLINIREIEQPRLGCIF